MHPLPELNDSRLYDLLEALGEQARTSARLLAPDALEGAVAPAHLAESAQRSAMLTDQIRGHLLRADMTSLPKADTEALASVLASIPLAAKRFAEGLGLAAGDPERVDFSSPLGWIEELSEIVFDMIRDLRGFESLNHIKDLHARVQSVADRAEMLIDEIVARTYQDPTKPQRCVMAKEVGERLQAIIDRYSEAGRIMNNISFAFF